MVNYLDKLKEKCIVDVRFFTIAEQLFDKLIEFGYISHRQSVKLQKKLYDNVDTILIGNDIQIDYKSGYYDAVKKEIYLKDLNNLESVYLRLLYAITTTETGKNAYSVGYSSTSLSKSSYKIEHRCFGMNRAVISNLVCRLLYTVPATLSIMPTYRSYENDFLGNKIASDNDIYFLEGKLLRQICYIFDVSEENLYSNLFTSPAKYLKKFFAKVSYDNMDKILADLDYISRKYSNYNKLVFFNKLLNDNYLNTKKRILENDISDLRQEKEKINLAIQNALLRITDENGTPEEENTDTLEINIESQLAEQINTLEDSILQTISEVQEDLVHHLIASESKYSSISFAIKLKELEKILIVKNSDLSDTIFKTVSLKLMNTFEDTSSNLIEKMKYSIINEVLSSDKYIKIYKNMQFKKLTGLKLPDNTDLIALVIDDTFMQLIEVNHLNEKMKELKSNTRSITVENMSYLLNNPTVTQDIHIYEKIFTAIHSKYPKFANVRIENMFLVNTLNNLLVIIMHDDTFSILQISQKDGAITSKMVRLSENYSIFNFKGNSNMPVIYNKKESTMQRLLAIFAIFS